MQSKAGNDGGKVSAVVSDSRFPETSTSPGSWCQERLRESPCGQAGYFSEPARPGSQKDGPLFSSATARGQQHLTDPPVGYQPHFFPFKGFLCIYQKENEAPRERCVSAPVHSQEACNSQACTKQEPKMPELHLCLPHGWQGPASSRGAHLLRS